MYKVLNENFSSYFYDKIQSHQVEVPYNTRNNQLRTPIGLIRCEQNIIYQGISIWNEIPDNLKAIRTCYSFKKHSTNQMIDLY